MDSDDAWHRYRMNAHDRTSPYYVHQPPPIILPPLPASGIDISPWPMLAIIVGACGLFLLAIGDWPAGLIVEALLLVVLAAVGVTRLRKRPS